MKQIDTYNRTVQIDVLKIESQQGSKNVWQIINDILNFKQKQNHTAFVYITDDQNVTYTDAHDIISAFDN